MYRGEHVDILYGNVKHAFFQVKNTYLSLTLVYKSEFQLKVKELY